ncbi:hypothetical protein BH09DEP1_BH09DEP1_7430 [soil metagenome]
MKNLIIFLSCIHSILLSMDAPPRKNIPARAQAALQLLQNCDLSAYKAIGCYDYHYQEMVEALRCVAPYARVNGINPDKPALATPLLELPTNENFFVTLSRWLFDNPPQLKLKQEGYDLVVSSFAFLFNQFRAKAADAIHIQLKPGGHLIIRGLSVSLPNDPLNRTITKLAQEKKWVTTLQGFDLNNYEFSFTKAQKAFPSDQWRNLSSQTEPSHMVFNNAKVLRQWISDWINEFPFNPSLPLQKKEDLATDFTLTYLQLFGLSYSGVNISIEAYKK